MAYPYGLFHEKKIKLCWWYPHFQVPFHPPNTFLPGTALTTHLRVENGPKSNEKSTNGPKPTKINKWSKIKRKINK